MLMNSEKLIKNILGNDAYIVSPLIGGMMNKSYIAQLGDKKYVLYISTEQANEMVDRPLEKEHLDIIYSLGITSKNVYFDADKGIKVNEYIEGSSLDKAQEFDYKKVAELFHALHASKTLSKEDYNPFKRFEGYEKESSEFVPNPDETYLKIRNFLMENKAYLQSQKLVLSHNDAQRSNIVKSDGGRYLFIDFEFVGNNDEIYDIACFGNGQVSEGFNLLKAYFNNPTEDQIRRYYLWRIYVSLQWYNVALVKHYRGEGALHGYNFLAVADHFLQNAAECYKTLNK